MTTTTLQLDRQLEQQSATTRSVTRAVVVAGDATDAHDFLPAPLLHLLDRPFIQHVVESLARQGITQFDVVLDLAPEQIERLLGNGSRWGVDIRFHLREPGSSPYAMLRHVTLNENEAVVLAETDRFYPGSVALLTDDGTKIPAAYISTDEESNRGSRGRWAGMSIVRAKEIDELSKLKTHREFESSMLAVCRGQGRTLEVRHTLDVSTGQSLLHSQELVLSGAFPEFMQGQRAIRDGVWAGRRCSISKTARINEPVFLGDHVHIGNDVELGPNAVIGASCVIDRRTIIADSLLLPQTHVGENLEVRDSIVDGNRMLNVRLGACVVVPDRFLLGDLQEHTIRPALQVLFSRTVATILLIALAPLSLLTWLFMRITCRGPVLHRREVLRLPAASLSERSGTITLHSLRTGRPVRSDRPIRVRRACWKHLVCDFIPGLIHVIRGEISLTGVTPSSAEELTSLPDEWRQLYLSSKAGLITESVVQTGQTEPSIERYVADAHYAVHATFSGKLALVMHYLRRLVF